MSREDPSELNSAILVRGTQRRSATLVNDVNPTRMVSSCRFHQVDSADVRPPCDEQFRGLNVAFPCSVHQGRPAILRETVEEGLN